MMPMPAGRVRSRPGLGGDHGQTRPLRPVHNVTSFAKTTENAHRKMTLKKASAGISVSIIEKIQAQDRSR